MPGSVTLNIQRSFLSCFSVILVPFWRYVLIIRMS